MTKLYQRLMTAVEIDEYFRILAAQRPEPETERRSRCSIWARRA